jgi:prepilin-type N-terminal cleavage/methylation domain-containing protein
MMGRALRPLNKDQRGMTLIELMLALAISAIIGGAVMTVVVQTFTHSARSNAHLTAVTEVERAVHAMTRDIVMAQKIENDLSGKVIQLTWTQWDNKIKQVAYTLVDGQLRRTHYTDGVEDGQSVAAEHITAADAEPEVYDGGTINLTITATVGTNTPQSETRVCEILPRPSF